jgi:hypothetical protein
MPARTGIPAFRLQGNYRRSELPPLTSDTSAITGSGNPIADS